MKPNVKPGLVVDSQDLKGFPGGSVVKNKYKGCCDQEPLLNS